MRRIFSILVLSFLSSLYAVSTDMIISIIRNEYIYIEKNLKKFSRKDGRLPVYESGSLSGYYENGKLRKIYVQTGNNFHETEKHFYFRHGRLFFVYIVTDAYEFVKSNVYYKDDNNRYYFHNGNMIRWLDKKRRRVSPGIERFRSRGKHIKETANEYRSRLH